ncbi:unnamed protein product [Rotaria sordida]|uniref:Uncharacterized protein n=2 Tax=Rotaria sordida TaxID=392033 RepID=A0A813Y0N2_9BILA|nr:unnamed protein product [Rotaria sordida]CAF0898663.1 unnamed protein product [Rotaria sordida]CAF3782348.1 unnamed protein product [Rotaria sordida]
MVLQTVSRIFYSQTAANQVNVEYQFVTSEVPGGFFGSRYNDYFSVILRSETGQYAMKSDSMNGLGITEFDNSTGASKWYKITLPVQSNQEMFRLDLNVANVGDAGFDSQVNARLLTSEQCTSCEQSCTSCTTDPICRDVCLNPPIDSCLFYREYRNIFIQTLKAEPQCISTVLSNILDAMPNVSSPVRNALSIVYHWLQSL